MSGFVDLDPDNAPEQPETLTWLRRSRHVGLPLIAGSTWEMPYILMREIVAVSEAETQFETNRMINEAMAAAHNQ